MISTHTLSRKILNGGGERNVKRQLKKKINEELAELKLSLFLHLGLERITTKSFFFILKIRLLATRQQKYQSKTV